MKPNSLFILLLFTMSGCGGNGQFSEKTAQPSDYNAYEIFEDEGREGIKVLIGKVTFQRASDGVTEIILDTKNNTNHNLWLPRSSDGMRGMSGAESVNLTEMESRSGGWSASHSDYSICRFPDQYEMLKPGQTWEHIHGLPENFEGKISISIWAPLRNEDSKELFSEEEKSVTIPDGDILIEEIRGIGYFDKAIHKQDL